MIRVEVCVASLRAGFEEELPMFAESSRFDFLACFNGSTAAVYAACGVVVSHQLR